jgi:hypothetical protein
MKLNLLSLLSAAAMVSAANAVVDPIEPVDLGTASNYVILSKAGISTVNPSAITGDIAVSPIAASAITGFDLVLESGAGGRFSTDASSQVPSPYKAYAANYASPIPSDLTTAVSDMESAYTNAAGRPNPNTDGDRINLGDGEIGGKTLKRGVYTFDGNVGITSDVTFDAEGNADAVFIIQIATDVVQAAETTVTLTNSAKAENIFWKVAGTVTVGKDAHMEGVLLVKTAAKFITGSTLYGRILSQTAVTLQKATIAQRPADTA